MSQRTHNDYIINTNH